MTGPFANRLFRITFVLAGVYNLAFGLWAGFWPLDFFQLFAIEPPRYPQIWSCVGMIVGVYGLLYLYVAWRLENGWPLIAVGLLGKVLGPIGMMTSFSPDWPRRLAMLCVSDDLIWWLPFGLFLIRGTSCGARVAKIAPWACVVTHLAALAMLGLFLHQGTQVESDLPARANYVGNHPLAWSIGWAAWMAAAASLVAFYAWWGARLHGSGEFTTKALPARTEILVGAVILTAMGMVCDFSGEGSAIWRMVGASPVGTATMSSQAWVPDPFVRAERDFTLFSAGAANGLYTLGGIILTLMSPNLPRWIRWAMWVTWVAAGVMTAAAIANNVTGMVVSTVVLFPPFLVWVAWMGARWRPT
ncbi:MAG TPA: hypothetical protein VH107_04405 [Lacipirellulaceae bacterium]|jgi:hypothetical protein|nr:hypothetical protein [Lacipirellulaceae bacterium]